MLFRMVVLPAAFLVLFTVTLDASRAAEALGVQERRLLERLIAHEYVFDPRGGKFVQMEGTYWPYYHQTFHGWLKPGGAGRPDRLYLAQGFWLNVGKDAKPKPVAFTEHCRELIAKRRKRLEAADEDDLRAEDPLGPTSQDVALIHAAWLHRLGYGEPAMEALKQARTKEDREQKLRTLLAQELAQNMYLWFRQSDDELALEYGERLFRVFGNEAPGIVQAKAQLDDLRRRVRVSREDRVTPLEKPADFDNWSPEKKIAWLIDALDEIPTIWEMRGRPQADPLGVASDWRMQELVRLGEAAVPSLIETAKQDRRLTRRDQRPFGSTGRLLTVRQMAIVVLQAILNVNEFEPLPSDDAPRARQDDVVDKIDAYWQRFGHLPLDERLMFILTHPQAKNAAVREAVVRLAELVADSTPDDASRGGQPVQADKQPHAIVAKFKNPTVVEAMLAALDREPAIRRPNSRDKTKLGEVREIEDGYICSIAMLRDRRALPELQRRYRSAEPSRLARMWAYACHLAGNSAPLDEFTGQLVRGEIVLSWDMEQQVFSATHYTPQAADLIGMLSCLSIAQTPACRRALDAIVDPDHALNGPVANYLCHERDYSLRWERGWLEPGDLFAHRFCQSILRQQLDCTDLTGATYRIVSENRIEINYSPSRGGQTTFGGELRDPDKRHETAQQRVHDVAARQLSRWVRGLPEYHPLFKDANLRLGKVKAFLDRHHGRFRPMSPAEREVLGITYGSSTLIRSYVPDIVPLGRSATAEDVRFGRAIFHLGGPGKPSDLKLPASAVCVSDDRKVIILQAETRQDGTAVYGVVRWDDFQALTGDEVRDVEPLQDADP